MSKSSQGTKPQRRKKVFALRTPERELNITFYEHFDDTFLYNKGITLMYAIKQGEQFKLDMNETLQSWGASPLTDKYFESLRSELYYAVLHQIEALFMLLVAPFYRIPDWLYLTAYTPDDVKEVIKQFKKGDVDSLSNGAVQDMQTFLAQSIYAGYFPSSQESASLWEKNLETIHRILTRLADKYEENLVAYNSYKHGLRVMTGPTWFGISKNDSNGNPTGEGWFRNSEDSLIYLEIAELTGVELADAKKQNPTVDQQARFYSVSETIQHFDPDECMFDLSVMAGLLENIKQSRLAHYKGEALNSALNLFHDVDLTALQHQWAGKHARTTWTI